MKIRNRQSFSSSTMMKLFLFLTFFLSSSMADLSCYPPPVSSWRKNYIVFVVKPSGQNIKDFAITTLQNILGSQKAAKESLGYIYRNVGSGFSAALSPHQASLLKIQPGVISVIESKVHQTTQKDFGLDEGYKEEVQN